jgi:hypothetical protein
MKDPGLHAPVPILRMFDVEATRRLSPGIEPHGVGIEMVLIDPASNELRFFQRTD